jgi:hypothetical protein
MTNDRSDRQVTVELVFPRLASDLEIANVRVLIEDTGEADAAAQTVARQDFASVRVSQGAGTLTLQVPVPNLAGASAPAIRVHVDTKGTGKVQEGDFLNPGMVPLTGENNKRYRVNLVRVS